MTQDIFNTLQSIHKWSKETRHTRLEYLSLTSCNTFKSVDIKPVNVFGNKRQLFSSKLPLLSPEFPPNKSLSEINEAKQPKVGINVFKRIEGCDINKELNNEKRTNKQ